MLKKETFILGGCLQPLPSDPSHQESLGDVIQPQRGPLSGLASWQSDLPIFFHSLSFVAPSKVMQRPCGLLSPGLCTAFQTSHFLLQLLGMVRLPPSPIYSTGGKWWVQVDGECNPCWVILIGRNRLSTLNHTHPSQGSSGFLTPFPPPSSQTCTCAF